MGTFYPLRFPLPKWLYLVSKWFKKLIRENFQDLAKLRTLYYWQARLMVGSPPTTVSAGATGNIHVSWKHMYERGLTRGSACVNVWISECACEKYVCIYVSACMFWQVLTCACMYLCDCEGVHSWMYVCESMHACVCIHVYVCTYVLRKVVFGDMEQVKEFNAGHSRYVKGAICPLFLHRLCRAPAPHSPSQTS